MTGPGDASSDTRYDPAAPTQAGPTFDQSWAVPGSMPSETPGQPVADYPTGPYPTGYPDYPAGPPSYPGGPANYPGYQQYGASYPPAMPHMPPPMPPPYGGSPAGFYPAPAFGGYQPPRPGTNTMAIISLVSSLLGVLCCFIGPIAGIVCGTIALNQIRQTREDGFAMAVAGLVVSVATLMIYLIFFVVSVVAR